MSDFAPQPSGIEARQRYEAANFVARLLAIDTASEGVLRATDHISDPTPVPEVAPPVPAIPEKVFEYGVVSALVQGEAAGIDAHRLAVEEAYNGTQ